MMIHQNDTWLAQYLILEGKKLSLNRRKKNTDTLNKWLNIFEEWRDYKNFRNMSTTDETYKITRLTTQLPQCRESLGGQSNINFKTYHEHKSSMTLPGNSYAGFREGNVVRGILCPSLTNSFRWVAKQNLKKCHDVLVLFQLSRDIFLINY